MGTLRDIFWINFVYNFTLTSKYIKGIDDVKTGFLSRRVRFISSYLMTNDIFMSMHSCCREAILTRVP